MYNIIKVNGVRFIMYREKIVKMCIIAGFVVIFLLFLPFFAVDTPHRAAAPVQNPDEPPVEMQQRLAQMQMQSKAREAQNSESSYNRAHNAGVSLYDDRDYLEAVAAFNEALRIKPNSAIDALYLGMCQSKLRRHDLAEQKFAQVESSYRMKKEYWLARAINARRISNDKYLEKAQNYIQQATEIAPDDLEILYNRAMITKTAYNEYRKVYEGQGGRYLEKPKNILIKAYEDLYNASVAQDNDKYIEIAQMGLEQLQNENLSNKSEQNPPNANTPSIQGVDPQLVENLPVLK